MHGDTRANCDPLPRAVYWPWIGKTASSSLQSSAASGQRKDCLVKQNKIIDAETARSCRLPTERRGPVLRGLSKNCFGDWQ
jgi:hypothetical protein